LGGLLKDLDSKILFPLNRDNWYRDDYPKKETGKKKSPDDVF
jgi:hypothetical protein